MARRKTTAKKGRTLAAPGKEAQAFVEAGYETKPREGAKKKKLTVMIDPELDKRFRIHCVKAGVNLSQGIEAAVAAWIEG